MMNRLDLYATQKPLLNALMALKETKKPASDRKSAGQDRAEAITFDDLLVSVGKTQNRDSFIRLFEYFAPRVKSFLMQGGMSPETADELAQETMLTAWDKASSFDPSKAKASTWIFTIARNKKTDYLRKYKRPPITEEDLAFSQSSEEAPDDIVSQTQETKALREAIEKLPEEQASLLHKSFFEDKTHDDIAKETKIPLGTVKSRIRLALDRLRYHMGTSES